MEMWFMHLARPACVPQCAGSLDGSAVVHAGAAVLLPKPGEAAEAAPSDISLQVGPDFSLRCLHPGARGAVAGMCVR